MKSGFGLVEAVFSAAIAAAFIVAVASVNSVYLSAAFTKDKDIEASYLAGEGLDAVKFMRDKSWDSLTSSVTDGSEYALSFSGSSWAIAPGKEYIDGFERRVVFNPVYRDGNNDIADSGTLDAGTKLVTVNVSWFGKNGTSTRSVGAYISNLFAN